MPEWHTYDTGRSILFSALPLPRALVHVVIEAALCGVLGWWLANRSNATFYLGWWIMIASGSLFFLENAVRLARRRSLFDLGDTFVESMHFAKRAERFTHPHAVGASVWEQRLGAVVQSFLRLLQMAFLPADRKRKDQKDNSRQHRQ